MRYRFIFLGILASVLFDSCSENDHLTGGLVHRQEMQVEANIHQEYVTRANDTGFAVGDAIGVYIVDYVNGEPTLKTNGNHADNVKFTYGQDGCRQFEECIHMIVC